MQINIKKLTIILSTIGVSACNGGSGSTNASINPELDIVSRKVAAADNKGSIKIMTTGQKISYAPRDDGELQPGGEIDGVRFVTGTNSEADCVIDKTTGFMWPKDGKLFAKTSWEDGLNKIKAINSDASTINYNLCGHTDWRMPNTNELETLINYAESSNANWLQEQGFRNIERNGMYWSSTSYNLDNYCAHDMAFSTNLDSGITGGRNKSKIGEPTAATYFQSIIPVRTADKNVPYQVPATGQAKIIQQISPKCPGGTNYTSPEGSDGDLQIGKKIPQNRFTRLSDEECVKDNLTGLIWVTDGSRYSQIIQNAYNAMGNGLKANGITWDNMNQYGVSTANKVKLCGRANWRLPTIREARSLYNYNVTNNADYLVTAAGIKIDRSISTGAWYMTSTPFAYKGSKSTILGNVGISAWKLQLNANLTGDEGQNGYQGILKNRDLQNVLLVSGGQTIQPEAKIKPKITDKVIFITQNGYSNFNGISGADDICNNEAQKSGSLIDRKAVFKALLIASNRYPCNANGVCGIDGFNNWPVIPNTLYTTVGNNGKIASNINGIFPNFRALLIRDQFGYPQNRFFWTGINGFLINEKDEIIGWSYANQDANWTKIMNANSTSTLSGAWSKYMDLTANDWTFPANITSAEIGDNGFMPDSDFDKTVGVGGFGYATKNVTAFDSASRWISKNTGWISYSYWTGPQTHIMCIQQ